MSVTSDLGLFARFLLCPEDSGAEGYVRQLCGSRCASALKAVFWSAVAVGGGLLLGQLGY